MNLLLAMIMTLLACSSDDQEVVLPGNDKDNETQDYIQFEAFTSSTSNILPSINGPFEETLNSPAALIKLDGTYYLFYNDYVGGWPPSDIRIGYATSTDLKSWSRNASITLSGEHVSYLNGTTEHPSVSSILVDDDGTLLLYFDIFKSGKASGVGLATADNVDGPWTVLDNTMIEPTPDTWDAYGIATSEVVKTETGYRMYYAGSMDGRTNPEMAIGMAESEDGRNWTKHSDPIFTKGDDDAWDAHKVETPRVLKTENGWVMAYRSDTGASTWGDGTGYGIATSEDGISWTRFQKEAVIHENNFNWATIWASAFHLEGDTYYLIAETDGPPVRGTRINIYSYDGDFF